MPEEPSGVLAFQGVALSGKLVSDVLRIEGLPSGVKFLLVALASHADDDGTNCRPGIRLLALETNQSERHVKRNLQKLKDMHFIEIEDYESGGRGNKTRYFVTLKKGDISNKRVTFEASKKGDISVKGDISNTERVTFETVKGDISNTPIRNEPSKNRHIEPSNNNYARKWVSILAQDSRWPERVSDTWIDGIESEFSTLNLELEADDAYRWLQQPLAKARNKSDLQRFFRNWLKTSKNGNFNGSRASPSRPDAMTYEQVPESWWGNEDT